jgi:predicted NUDIX family phosphoesterase
MTGKNLLGLADMDQLVLVFEAAVLRCLGEFQGYTLDVEKYLSAILDPKNSHFLHRKIAEHDTRYKQLVPYIILRYGNTVFSYVRGRQSSETRLLAKRSIGLGGHIEPRDFSLFSSTRDFYLETARREVSEEVGLGTSYVEHVVALINDNSNDVGKVHFGIVHIWDLSEPKVIKRERKITQAGFVTLERLTTLFNELETWSQIVFKILENPRTPQYETERKN